MAAGGVPELGGYEYEFIGVIPDDWECLVCQLPLKDPVQIERCGHRLCEICVGTILRSPSPQCPADREPISRDRIFSDVACHRKILDAKVKCPNADCSWTGELRDVKRHGENCSFQLVQCINCGCHEKVLRKDVIKHVESTCLWSIMQCAFCAHRFPKLEKKPHNDSCPSFPVECSNKCGLRNIPREEADRHIDETCPLTVINCEYSAIGCAIKFQRRDSQAHLDAMKDTHLHLACKGLVTMSKIIEEQAEKIKHLEGKLDRFQYSPFVWKISNFALVMAAAQKNERRVIVSDPFYSCKNGYKFCLELYPDGYHVENNILEEKIDFMSIYLRVLVGEYDGLLIWPFQDSAVFTLLDQNELVGKRRHIKQQITDGLPRPSETEEPACGVWQFVFHKDLFSRSYIKDDTIFIKVAFVEEKELIMRRDEVNRLMRL